jgi:capsular polysaccharide biosynthesis protein
MELMRWIPLKSRLYRATHRSRRHIREAAEKTWTLCPPEQFLSPAAIFLPGELDRVHALMSDTTPSIEQSRILGGHRVHSAAIAYQLSHVELLDGSLYKGLHRHRLLKKPYPAPQPSVVPHIEKAGLACSLYCSYYFAHWIGDDMTKHLAVEEFGTPIAVERKRYHHEPGYSQLFGIEQNFLSQARFDQLVMLDDFGQNSFKRARYTALRTRLKGHFTGTPNQRVFLRRGSSGAARPLANSHEVEAFLTRQGYQIVDPEHLTAEEILRSISGARIVLGVEGSQLVHGLFHMADNATLCAIQPPKRFTNLHKDFTDCMGMQYGFLVGDPSDDGFALSLPRLERFLDKVESQTRF